jgi:hypothetical protein
MPPYGKSEFIATLTLVFETNSDDVIFLNRLILNEKLNIEPSIQIE